MKKETMLMILSAYWICPRCEERNYEDNMVLESECLYCNKKVILELE